jgi:hypothetical protein
LIWGRLAKIDNDPADEAVLRPRRSRGACTHTGFLPESDSTPVVEFFTRTGITSAGGQFGFERCTRTMFVHRNRKRNLLVPLYLRRVGFRLTYLKQSSSTDRCRHVCKFQCSYIDTDKPAAGHRPPAAGRRPGARLVEIKSGTLICRTGTSAGTAACENTHLFTSHPAP